MDEEFMYCPDCDEVHSEQFIFCSKCNERLIEITQEYADTYNINIKEVIL